MSTLITGGTGTLGNELVRRSLGSENGRVIVLSRDEEKQWRMGLQLRREGMDTTRLRFFIGDVRDRARLFRAFEGVDLVIHAAAMKQVPACEYNPVEAVKTNIGGTQNAIEAALDAAVGRFVLISSDKAVQPVNLYGMTKGAAEKLTVHSNAYAGKRRTRFAAVRYGNVVGSRGSLFDLLKHHAPPLPITHPDMTRFWFSVSDAADFVLQASRTMQGGEIYVPRKIKARSVRDLAEIARPRTQHKIIGIRPGEKIHEKLICREESRRTVAFENCYVIEPENPSWPYDQHPRGCRMPEDWEMTSRDTEQLGDDEALRFLESAA